MRLAFTTSGIDLRGPLDERFGRAPRFLIYDTETGSIVLVDNGKARNETQGAGIRAAERLAAEEVDCVITGHCGPQALRVLSAAGILVFECGAPTVAAALDLYRSGRLSHV